MNKNTSLDEVHQSIDATEANTWRQRLFIFLGPAFLVAVGYMDPGNWATDIAGGSKYGYSLLWVLLLSNMIALLLQTLSARLGIVRGRDLAQASRETYPGFVNLPLFFLAEIAIAACDLAEGCLQRSCFTRKNEWGKRGDLLQRALELASVWPLWLLHSRHALPR